MHFSLPTAKFNLFVKIKERCLYIQLSIGTGYLEKLFSFSPWKFSRPKNKAPSNLTKCLSFQQEVGLETSRCPLQYESLRYYIPYSDISYSMKYPMRLFCNSLWAEKRQELSGKVLCEGERIAVPMDKIFNVWMK